MNFDFTIVTDRRNTGSYKWEFAPEPVKSAGVIPLSVADMEYRVPDKVSQAIAKAVAHGIYGYTTVDDEYFGAVAGWMKHRHGFEVKRDRLVVTPGVVAAVGSAIRAFSSEGDGVIIQTPVYYPFAMAIRANRRVELDNSLILKNGRYEMDFEGLEALCAKKNTKILILCSPHNPTGRVWTRRELERVCDICTRNNVFVIADEIHSDIVLSGNEHTVYANIEGAEDSCMVCTAVSKTFNLAGLSCSNIFVPNKANYDKYLEAVSRDSTVNVPYFARAATISAYNECEDWLKALLCEIESNFEYLYKYIAKNLPMLSCVRAEGTYLAWVDMRALSLSDEALEDLAVNKALLALDEGYVFGAGGSGFERWNLALPQSELKKALDRLCAAITGKDA